MTNGVRRRLYPYGMVQANKWSISDFKSIERAEISLANGRLSVLTGTNSIGKSSLLQSLLMLCQSINNYGEDFVLNGALARLGVPEDVVRDGKQSFRIGVDYAIKARPRDEQKLQVSASVSFAPHTVGDKSNELSVLAVSDVILSFSSGCSINIGSSEIAQSDIEECRETWKLRHRDVGDLTILKASNDARGQLTRTYVAFHGLQPIYVIRLRSESEAYEAHKKSLSNFISSGLRYYGREEMLYLEAIASELLPQEEYQTRNVPMHMVARKNNKRLSEMLDSMPEDELDGITNKIARSLADSRRHVMTEIDDRVYHFGVDDIEGDITQQNDYALLVASLSAMSGAYVDIALRVAYIGPLRDDPRVISPLTEEAGNNLPIGAKGERAAAILLANYRKEGRYGLPNTNHPQRTTLGEAVNAWTQYLGVGNAVHAANKQKLGVSINIFAKALLDQN